MIHIDKQPFTVNLRRPRYRQLILDNQTKISIP
jgi:hypothetical protein